MKIPAYEKDEIGDAMFKEVDEIGEIAKDISKSSQSIDVIGIDGFVSELKRHMEQMDKAYERFQSFKDMLETGSY